MENGTRKNDMGDYLFDALSEYLEHVTAAYQQHEAKRPVPLFDIQERQIYAYPYEDFKSELSAKSQVSLAEQYEQAQKLGQMVVFVRDNDNQRLVAYSMDCE